MWVTPQLVDAWSWVVAPDLLPCHLFWVMQCLSRGQVDTEMEVVEADSVGLWRRLQAKSRAEKTLGQTIFSGPEPWPSYSFVMFGLSATDC